MLMQNIALAFLCGVAGWQDAVSGRIPNAVTYGGILAGLILALAQPPYAAVPNLIGFVLGFGLLTPFWARNMIGGGDVKLAMMVGALKGPGFLLYFFFYVFSLCVVVILYSLVARVGLLRSMVYLFQNLWSLMTFRAFPEPPNELKNIRVPFGLLAMVAVLFCIALESFGYLTSPFE